MSSISSLNSNINNIYSTSQTTKLLSGYETTTALSTLIKDYALHNNLISSTSNIKNNISTLSNNLISSSSSLDNNLVSSISSLNNHSNYYYTKTTTNSLLTNYATLGNLIQLIQ